MTTDSEQPLPHVELPPPGPNWYRTSLAGRVVKRTMDVVLSAFGIVVISPVLLVLAILIKRDSEGPVFYRGVRTGLHGATFRIFKFRTMVVDAEKIGGGSTAKGDPRITKVGHFIRRHKLDELPQLLNVFSGEMSMVGPRPELPRYTDEYMGDEKEILEVKPGITDFSSIEFIQLGDVLGSENADQVYEEKVRPVKNRLRIRYARQMSPWVDLKLILLTLKRLVFGKP